jgi:hypothetical protein
MPPAGKASNQGASNEVCDAAGISPRIFAVAARLDEKQNLHRPQRLRQLRIHSAIGSHATYIICVTENCQPEGAENREGGY